MADDDGAPSLADDLETLGFRSAGVSRRGRVWTLAYNRYLRFTLHEYPAATPGAEGRLLLSWSFAWGEFVLQRGWQLSVTDESAAELYPAGDTVVPADAEAVRGEVLRILTTLRLDLGAPEL